MTRIILLLILLSASLTVTAQCVSGDCRDGEGKMDFGYAVYTGSFKAGLPDGTGTMDYGGGDKYAGSFKGGKEHGTGLLFKKGVARPVAYSQGEIVTRKESVVIGGNEDWKDGVPGCVSGDCANGQGVMKFPSGNRYEGSFRNYQFNGRGKMSFASGNVLEGTFVDHLPVEGSFLYKGEGVLFRGTFNPDGTPLSGTYTNPGTGGIVDVRNGSITSVKNPRLDSIRAAQPKLVTGKCPRCNGEGWNSSSKTTYKHMGGIGRVGATGFVTWDYEPRSIGSTTKSYNACDLCKGSGKVESYQR